SEPNKNFVYDVKQHNDDKKINSENQDYLTDDSKQRPLNSFTSDNDNDNDDEYQRSERAAMQKFGPPSASFLRFGRSNPSFLRFGRSNPSFLRFGRSNPSFLRFGRTNLSPRLDWAPVEKRTQQASFLRFG
ncbi:unnamed protein product, partial [Didymodactylos carnosus]